MKKLIFAIFVIATLNAFGQPNKLDSGYVYLEEWYGIENLSRMIDLTNKAISLGMAGESVESDGDTITHPDTSAFVSGGYTWIISAKFPTTTSNEPSRYWLKVAKKDIYDKGLFPMEYLILSMNITQEDVVEVAALNVDVYDIFGDSLQIVTTEPKVIRRKIALAMIALDEHIGIEERRRR